MGDLANEARPKPRYSSRRSAQRSYAYTYDGKSTGSRRQLLRAARSAIGTPYVVGGSSPGGFDCSGLVCWAYGNVGVKLPRTAREQSVVGTKVRDLDAMQEGDIVAFRHPKRGYHTGIYVGDGKFIHSPRRKSHVKINSLDDPYFSETFLGARRINLSGRENLLAQAESRLRNEQEFSPSRSRYLRLHREDSRASHNASREKSSRSERAVAQRHSSREAKKDRKDSRYQVVADNSRSRSKDAKQRKGHKDEMRDSRASSRREEARGHSRRDASEKHASRASRNDRKHEAKDSSSRKKQHAALNAKPQNKRSKPEKKKSSSRKS
ncbi:MAG: C40 family peptidase [Desulfovibrio sp.]|nr:C40 family peptidase [Desulfovibrio sp.]